MKVVDFYFPDGIVIIEGVQVVVVRIVVEVGWDTLETGSFEIAALAKNLDSECQHCFCS